MKAILINGVWQKYCPKCERLRAIGLFNRDNGRSDGRQGWCRDCGHKAVNQCYADNREHYLAQHADYRQTHAAEHRARNLTYFHTHKAEHAPHNRVRQRSVNWQRKLLIIQHYGPLCGCCFEADPHFLSIHHLAGKGTQHRRRIGAHGSAFYKYLINEGLPEGYGILCMSCNFVLGIYGFCPHQEDSRPEIKARPLTVWRKKLQMIQAYGGTCACCQESSAYFLQIDHINGGGNVHRESIRQPGGYTFYLWLERHGWPKGYRLLCVNCNYAYGRYDFCPHTGRGKQLTLWEA